MTEPRRRKPPIFGLLLVSVGVVLLLQTLQIISWSLWYELWRFWPLLLVALGVHLIVGRRYPILVTAFVTALIAVAFVGAAIFAESEGKIWINTFAEPLGDISKLNIRVANGIGSLELGSLRPESPNVAEGFFEAECRGAAMSFDKRGDEASIEIETDARVILCGWNSYWRISLSRIPQTTLDIGTGASSIVLDLTDIKVVDLNVSAGASSIDITMPANAGSVDAHITAGASSINVQIPEGVEARIIRDSGISSFDVSNRFPSLESRDIDTHLDETIASRHLDDIFESPGYRDASNRINIEFDVGVSSVSIH